MFTLKFYKKIKHLPLILGVLSSASFSHANDFKSSIDYQNFKQKTMQTYGLTEVQVDWAMDGAKNLPNIINIMNRPGESKPWYAYKTNFLSEGTIKRGVTFKNQYADTLNRAEQQFGVPQSVILGILGVETGYGSNKGSFVTRDALATLGFGYERRAQYFKDELASLIAWSYKDDVAANSIVESYAGKDPTSSETVALDDGTVVVVQHRLCIPDIGYRLLVTAFVIAVERDNLVSVDFGHFRRVQTAERRDVVHGHGGFAGD